MTDENRQSESDWGKEREHCADVLDRLEEFVDYFCHEGFDLHETEDCSGKLVYRGGICSFHATGSRADVLLATAQHCLDELKRGIGGC